jgi:pSer/pThr/pTyr-binding forkhead associated (FHA) protein
MSDAVLTVLKFCLLALVYLFLVRVVWTVARELRGTPAPTPAPLPPQPAPATPAPPRGRKRQWRLVVVQPDAERGQSFAVEGDSTIGRGGGCAVPLTFDTFVSQVHARASDRNGELWVEDVGSTNGTYVNGERIDKPTKLRKGDRVQVGETVLEAGR